LTLLNVILNKAEFKEFVANASSLISLKTLDVVLHEDSNLEMIAEAGRRGGWPSLRSCCFTKFREEVNDEDEEDYEEYWNDHCKELLTQIWPGSSTDFFVTILLS
jgi:hypothetical protein